MISAGARAREIDPYGEACGRRGSALLLSLIAVTVVTTVGLAFLQLSATTARRSRSELDAQQAFYLAEAGLAEAFQGVRIGRTGRIASEVQPAVFGNGLLWVTAEDTAEGQVRLESTARVGAGRSVLALVVEPVEQALGFFADEELVVESVLLLDGFNSEERAYVEEVLAHQETLGQPAPEPEPAPETDLTPEDAKRYRTWFEETYSKELFTVLMDPGVPIDVYKHATRWRYEWNDKGGVLQSVRLEEPDHFDLQDKLPSLLSFYGGSTQPIDADSWVQQGSGTESSPPPTETESAGTGAETTPGETSSPGSTSPGSTPNTGSGGLLGSNADVVFQGSTGEPVEIYGDVVPGPEGMVVGSADLSVSGATDPRPNEVELPEVEVPTVALEPPAYHDGLLPMVLPPGVVGYEALEVAADAELVLTGPATVVIGALDLAAGATLTLDTRDGAVDLYITGHMDLAPGSLVETTSLQPDELSIQVASRPDDGNVDLNLAATSQFHGVIYSPDADVRVGSDFEVFGSIVARRLEIAPGARLHFDNANFEGSPIPEVVSWRILELPAADRSRGTDPFEAHGLDPNALPSLGHAHDLEAVLLVIEYLDVSGATITWSGSEADFDWDQVATILRVERDPNRDELEDDLSEDEPEVEEPADGEVRPEVRAAIDELMGKALRDFLIANQPLSDAELIAFLDADTMSSIHHKEVLFASGQLSSAVLERLLTAPQGLDSGTLKEVLLNVSPLPTEIVPLVEAVPPDILSDWLREEILAAQGS